MKNKTLIYIGIIILVLIVGLIIFNQPAGTEENEVELTGETKEFEIIAKQWEFDPPLIEVNKGDKVELHMESIDVRHGLTILEFGVAETLELGEDVHVEFIADKSGTFNFFCHISCGKGHNGMRGLLVVK